MKFGRAAAIRCSVVVLSLRIRFDVHLSNLLANRYRQSCVYVPWYHSILLIVGPDDIVTAILRQVNGSC